MGDELDKHLCYSAHVGPDNALIDRVGLGQTAGAPDQCRRLRAIGSQPCLAAGIESRPGKWFGYRKCGNRFGRAAAYCDGSAPADAPDILRRTEFARCSGGTPRVCRRARYFVRESLPPCAKIVLRQEFEIARTHAAVAYHSLPLAAVDRVDRDWATRPDSRRKVRRHRHGSDRFRAPSKSPSRYMSR